MFGLALPKKRSNVQLAVLACTGVSSGGGEAKQLGDSILASRVFQPHRQKRKLAGGFFVLHQTSFRMSKHEEETCQMSYKHPEVLVFHGLGSLRT